MRPWSRQNAAPGKKKAKKTAEMHMSPPAAWAGRGCGTRSDGMPRHALRQDEGCEDEDEHEIARGEGLELRSQLA